MPAVIAPRTNEKWGCTLNINTERPSAKPVTNKGSNDNHSGGVGMPFILFLGSIFFILFINGMPKLRKKQHLTVKEIPWVNAFF